MKISSNCIKAWNVRFKAIKLIKKNLLEKFHDLGFDGNSWIWHQKLKLSNKSKGQFIGLHQVKNFCASDKQKQNYHMTQQFHL